MFKRFISNAVVEAINSAGIIGLFIGILSIGLDEDKSTMKGKVVGIIWAIIFAIFTALIMAHFNLVESDKSSDYLVFAVIGIVSFNQAIIRKIARLMIASFTKNPFETIEKIKGIIRK
ncbi:MAG: hypothetical protein BWY78_00572 [Alphaproteobacteria bacterium ADurb.Bin438]|nr:MAG: hypothetical protein BWY78_00572 [Alphaproteobacteria bacterium ADurb.Bin438]